MTHIKHLACLTTVLILLLFYFYLYLYLYLCPCLCLLQYSFQIFILFFHFCHYNLQVELRCVDNLTSHVNRWQLHYWRSCYFAVVDMCKVCNWLMYLLYRTATTRMSTARSTLINIKIKIKVCRCYCFFYHYHYRDFTFYHFYFYFIYFRPVCTNVLLP